MAVESFSARALLLLQGIPVSPGLAAPDWAKQALVDAQTAAVRRHRPARTAEEQTSALEAAFANADSSFQARQVQTALQHVAVGLARVPRPPNTAYALALHFSLLRLVERLARIDSVPIAEADIEAIFELRVW